MDDRDEKIPKKEPTDFIKIGEISLPEGGDLSDINKSLRRKIFDLYTIFEISRHLNSMLDVNSLLDAILFTCIGQMRVSGAAITVQNTGVGDFSKFHVKGITLPESVTWSFSRVGPLARHLRRVGKPQTISALKDRVPNDSDDYTRLRTLEAELVVPLIAKSNLLGILFLPRKISGAPFHDEDLEFVSILVNQLSVAIDNANLYESERKALRELRSAQERLLESERLAALGRLSASIAHEVNNPLGIIKNYLTIISKSIQRNPDLNSHIGIVRDEVDRIAFIVKQLLEFYRPTLKQTVEFDLCHVLESTLELMKNEFSKNNIELSVPDERLPCRLVGSPEKIKQVFLNLLINARDAMTDGGKLSVSLAGKNSQIEVMFTDTGPGIDEEVLPNIFEPFYTTKKDSGMGLGLAVCYGIIRSHKGVIEAYNNDEGGATFLIKLPLVKNE
jgi:signal transduction histidine kinase